MLFTIEFQRGGHGGNNSESIYGRVHRVASADDLGSVTFNLTDKNSTFETNDYDQRIIFVNGSATTVNPATAASPGAACYTSDSVSQFYLCSYDQTEFSPTKTSGVVYAGRNANFVQLCNDNSTSPDYLFNVTGTGAFKTIIPIASSATCNNVGNQTSIIEDQGVPSRPFGLYDLKGPAKLQMSLNYDRIFLNGTARFGVGAHKICIEKTGRSENNVVVSLRIC